MFLLFADKNKLYVRQREMLTSRSVNVYPVMFQFSNDWANLTKVAVFRMHKNVVQVLLDNSLSCTVPWEVLESSGTVEVGVYGTYGDEVRLPTRWARLGEVFPGAFPGRDAQPPTPDLWQQELDRKGDTLAYDGLNLTLKSGKKELSSVEITGGGGSGITYKFGHGLKQDGVNVSVDAVSDFTGDNTLPMTAAGVQTTVGNIEAMLATI